MVGGNKKKRMGARRRGRGTEMGRQHEKGTEGRRAHGGDRDNPVGWLEMTLERWTGLCHQELSKLLRGVDWITQEAIDVIWAKK